MVGKYQGGGLSEEWVNGYPGTRLPARIEDRPSRNARIFAIRCEMSGLQRILSWLAPTQLASYTNSLGVSHRLSRHLARTQGAVRTDSGPSRTDLGCALYRRSRHLTPTQRSLQTDSGGILHRFSRYLGPAQAAPYTESAVSRGNSVRSSHRLRVHLAPTQSEGSV